MTMPYDKKSVRSDIERAFASYTPPGASIPDGGQRSTLEYRPGQAKAKRFTLERKPFADVAAGSAAGAARSAKRMFGSGAIAAGNLGRLRMDVVGPGVLTEGDMARMRGRYK